MRVMDTLASSSDWKEGVMYELSLPAPVVARFGGSGGHTTRGKWGEELDFERNKSARVGQGNLNSKFRVLGNDLSK